jgi:thiosulfate/3-mercaptopyruvate sulfurtransferase
MTMTSVLASPADLAAMDPASIAVIDTRAPEALAAGHVPGAVNLHDMFTNPATPDANGIEEMTSKFAKAFGSAGRDGTKTAVIDEGSIIRASATPARATFCLAISALLR